MRRKNIFLLIAVLVLLAGAATAVHLKGCIWKADSLQTVRIGAAIPTAALVYVANEEGLFTRHGVNAVVKDYALGPVAVKALVDEVDLATAAEFVMVQQSFEYNNLRTFAQIANANSMIELIARKDRGIEQLSDLKGKKIGLPRGSSSEFYLGGYLKRSNIPLSSVEMVHVDQVATVEALYNGSVDAVVIWEPHATRIKGRLGENGISCRSRGATITTSCLLPRKSSFGARRPRPKKCSVL